MTAAPASQTGLFTIRIVGRNTCQFAIPNAWAKQASTLLWAVLEVVTTTH